MRKRWNRHTILAAVRERGSSLAAIGREIGLSRPSMSNALTRCCHPRANEAIARVLERPVHELWPLWFDEAGRRRPSARRRGAFQSRKEAA